MRGKSQTARLAATTAGAAAMLLGIVHAPQARAETILVDNQIQIVKSDVARPSGGMTMQAVEQRFGSPRERHATVGTPPITRWDYEHFAVFFEKDRVIDAVVTVAPASGSPDSTPSSIAPPVDASAPPDATPAASGASSPATATPASDTPAAATPAAAPAQSPSPLTPISRSPSSSTGG